MLHKEMWYVCQWGNTELESNWSRFKEISVTERPSTVFNISSRQKFCKIQSYRYQCWDVGNLNCKQPLSTELSVIRVIDWLFVGCLTSSGKFFMHVYDDTCNWYQLRKIVFAKLYKIDIIKTAKLIAKQILFFFLSKQTSWK